MIEKLLTFTIFVTVGWLLLVAMLSLQEKSLIFLPSKTLGRTPRDLGLTARGRSLFAEPTCSGSLAMSD